MADTEAMNTPHTVSNTYFETLRLAQGPGFQAAASTERLLGQAVSSARTRG